MQSSAKAGSAVGPAGPAGGPAGRTVLVAFGTRPEFVKLAPVVAALKRGGTEVRTVATGQHHDLAMSDVFFEELALWPDERWKLEGDAAHRLGEMTERAERELAEHRPHLVLVLGDTHTVPVFGLAARRAGVPVAHLESGIRSFNETSLEEVNRRVGAACASLHLAPTELAAQFLEWEGVARERVRVIGNPIIDLLVGLGLRRLPPSERGGVLVTAHRATNVDDRDRLASLVDLVLRLAKEVGTVTFPVHPRTARRLDEFGETARLRADSVELLPPLPYGEMLGALRRAAVVVTDSGGVQEEASYFGVPSVVLRRSTPRWEGVLLGSSRLVGMDVEAALGAAIEYAAPGEQRRVAELPCPYGDGTTGVRLAGLLADPEVWSLLELREPRTPAVPEVVAAALRSAGGPV